LKFAWYFLTSLHRSIWRARSGLGDRSDLVAQCIDIAENALADLDLDVRLIRVIAQRKSFGPPAFQQLNSICRFRLGDAFARFSTAIAVHGHRISP